MFVVLLMATVQRFEDLKVWQKAREQAKHIYELTKQGDFSRDYELKNQISRSSGSVMDNIAEGFGRGSRTEFLQFLGYSLGSNDEVKSQLYRALDREHVDLLKFTELYNQADWVTRMITSFMNYLKKSSYKGFKYNVSGVEESVEVDYALPTNDKQRTSNV